MDDSTPPASGSRRSFLAGLIGGAATGAGATTIIDRELYKKNARQRWDDYQASASGLAEDALVIFMSGVTGMVWIDKMQQSPDYALFKGPLADLRSAYEGKIQHAAGVMAVYKEKFEMPSGGSPPFGEFGMVRDAGTSPGAIYDALAKHIKAVTDADIEAYLSRFQNNRWVFEEMLSKEGKNPISPPDYNSLSDAQKKEMITTFRDTLTKQLHHAAACGRASTRFGFGAVLSSARDGLFVAYDHVPQIAQRMSHAMKGYHDIDATLDLGR